MSLGYTEDDLANAPARYDLNNFTPYYSNVSTNGNAMDSVTKLLQSRTSQSSLSPTYYTNEFKKVDSTNPSDQNKKNNSSSWWNGGTLGAIAGTVMNNLNGIAGISNSILGWKQFSENKKLIAKQMENIDEQIAASKEYRQQRADEIARLNRVRNNTQKAFNTGTTITRSY